MATLDPARIERILVQAPNWLGDFAMATPAFRCIRDNFPNAEITLLTRRYLLPLLEGAPWFDDVIPYDPSGRDRGWRGWRTMVRALRSRRFDVSILLTNSFRTALLARLSGARRRVGYDLEGRGWLLTDRLRPPMAGRGKRVPKPMPEYYLDLLEHFGLQRGSDRMELFVTPELRERGDAWLAEHGIEPGDRFVALNPGASFGASKLWNPASFARVGDALASEGAKVLVLFGPGEEDLASDIRGRMTRPTVDPEGRMIALDLLKCVLERCDLLVTTDAGPRHVAVAFARPVVCVMGPTDPRYSATNLEQSTVLREDVDCAPCHLKTCPIDHRCMERLTPERVLEACRRWLA